MARPGAGVGARDAIVLAEGALELHRVARRDVDLVGAVLELAADVRAPAAAHARRRAAAHDLAAVVPRRVAAAVKRGPFLHGSLLNSSVASLPVFAILRSCSLNARQATPPVEVVHWPAHSSRPWLLGPAEEMPVISHAPVAASAPTIATVRCSRSMRGTLASRSFRMCRGGLVHEPYLD